VTVAPFPRPASRPDVDELRTFTPALWHGQPVPRRQWLVEGLIPIGSVSMLSGDGGQGKSLIAQQLMTAIATGQDWLGYSVKRVRVFGLFCEDPMTELQIRQADINRHYRVEMADLGEDVTMASRADQTSYLCRFENRFDGRMQATPLWHDLVARVRDFGAQLVILDTVRKTFGGNEINDRQVTAYMIQLKRLAIQIGGAILLTAHPSNDGISSGSGLAGNRAWHNEARSRMYLTDAGKNAEDKPDVRVLRVRKANYGAPGGKIELKWRRGVFERIDGPKLKNWSEPEQF
jgi:RecA-family ATPase